MTNQTITDLEGVYANGIHCGIKDSAKDLAFIYVPEAKASAGVFTKNKCAAPSVALTKSHLKQSTLKAIIVSSGNANAYTGEQGHQDTERMISLTASALGLQHSEVGVASTGVIGVPLPMTALESGINRILETPKAKEGHAAAEAILTVDLVTKEVYKASTIEGEILTVAGISKGSGMIAPNMATTLSYLVTDADLDTEALQAALSEAIDLSLNQVSVDTDTSTNDMVLLLSTGKKPVHTDSAKRAFQDLLNEACIDIAKQMAKDGEGAQKLFEVRVNGAASDADARSVSKNVVSSPLVKTAVAAASANWGRLVMAIGKDESVQVDPSQIDIAIGDVFLVKKGVPAQGVRELAESQMQGEEVIVTIDLHQGTSSATAWGCDMTEEFIRINAEYN